MILADTSVWIDHFRAGDAQLAVELGRSNILMHSHVEGELALGSFRHRDKILTTLRCLPFAITARTEEVRALIERRALHGRGIGYVDTHLLASVLITPHCQLWTRDKRLRAVAESLKIHVHFP
jgi:predicted nucleic acid-binding protein